MIPEWVTEELQTLDLGDARCDMRLMKVLADLAPQPTVSLPAAVGGGRAETEAVYRFFENDHFDFTDILTPLDQPRGAAKQLALKKQRQKTPIEDKESQRWVDGMHLAHRLAAEVPDTQLILVSDSEADIFELLVAGQFPDPQNEPPTDETGVPPAHAEWIVRGSQNRAVLPDDPTPETSPTDDDTTNECLKTVLAKVSATPVLKSYEVQVRGRDPKVSCETRGRRQARESRSANVEVRACQMKLRAPYRPGHKLPAGHHDVCLEMANRDCLPSAQTRLSVGGSPLRDAGQCVALHGRGVGDFVADDVCDADRSRVSRPELRGGVRGLGMESGVSNHSEETAAGDPADIARDGANGRPIGRLRESLDRRDARR